MRWSMGSDSDTMQEARRWVEMLQHFFPPFLLEILISELDIR